MAFFKATHIFTIKRSLNPNFTLISVPILFGTDPMLYDNKSEHFCNDLKGLGVKGPFIAS